MLHFIKIFLFKFIKETWLNFVFNVFFFHYVTKNLHHPKLKLNNSYREKKYKIYGFYITSILKNSWNKFSWVFYMCAFLAQKNGSSQFPYLTFFDKSWICERSFKATTNQIFMWRMIHGWINKRTNFWN
jgi:hypothetical protein